MSAPTATATVATAVSTSANRVDWRNYDYSDGPPKTKTTLTNNNNRDVNPYSKRDDFPLMKTKSLTTDTTTNSNIDEFGAGNGLGTKASASKFNLQTRSFDSGLLPITKTGSNATTVDTNYGECSLTYRPAKAKTKITPIRTSTIKFNLDNDNDNDDDEEDKLMALPKVKKYAENLSDVKHDSAEPFDHYTSTGMTKNNNRPASVTPLNSHANARTKNNGKGSFEQVWQEAEKDWKGVSRVVISDDDDDENDNHNKRNKKFQFDDFAGDRSRASTRNGNNDDEDDRSSEDSVGRMDVPLSVAPISILKNSRRFDSSSNANSSHSVCSNPSIGSKKSNSNTNTKSKNKKSSNIHTIEETPVAKNHSSQSYNPKAKTQQTQQQNQQQQQGKEQNETEDDDTLFEFSKGEENKIKKDVINNYSNSNTNRRRKSRGRTLEEDDEGDDTSIDDNGVSPTKKRADTLKDRTKQAWSVRNRATAAAASTSTTSASPVKREKVAFHNNATVREFNPELEDEEGDEEESLSLLDEDSDDCTEYTEMTEDDGTYIDDDTYAGRSMHSIYSKSNESEAEDMIKDIFLIGKGEATNPGRRQLRYKKGRKKIYEKRMKQNDDDDTIEDSVGDSTLDGGRTRSNNIVRDDDDIAVNMLYSLCEDSLSAFGDVCSLFSSTANQSTTEFGDEETIDSQSTGITEDGWFQNASSILFYADISAQTNGLCSSSSSSTATVEGGKAAVMNMSLNAARMKHTLRNLKYDDTQSMNVIHDIDLVTVSVGIPLGIGFEESEYGCWVKKLFKNGNALNSSSGDSIQAGDHLASINGTSVFKKSIKEVCKMLAACNTPNAIQLSFLRYIGPIRNSNANEQQGYEVIDPHIGKSKQSTSPVKLSRSLSNIDGEQPLEKIDEGTILLKSKKIEKENEELKEVSKKLSLSPKKMLSLSMSPKKKLNLSMSPKKKPTLSLKKKQSLSPKKKKKGFGLFRRRKGNDSEKSKNTTK